MPSYNWSVNPINLIQQFEARHNSPTAGALLMWAVSAVDCLYYLDDIDREFDNSRVSLAGHKPDVIDIAHARWATGTSITAVDLCAAGLGRTFCGHRGKHEFNLGSFDPSSKQSKAAAKCRAQMPIQAQNWVDSVIHDSQYNVVKSARDWLTHSRLPRHFNVAIGGPPQRLELGINSNKLPVRNLIELARDFASRHVFSFIQLLPQI